MISNIKECVLESQSLIKRGVRAFGSVAHYLRWSWRFQSFGFRSRLVSPDLLTRSKLIHIGNRVQIWKSARLEVVSQEVGEKGHIRIGDNSVIHPYFHCGAAESIRIGSDVLIASRVYITDHDHTYDDPVLPAGQVNCLRSSPVIIDDGAWIGEGAVVLKGVRIGKRAVVGANCVVTRDVPDRAVVVGNPARIIRTLDVM